MTPTRYPVPLRSMVDRSLTVFLPCCDGDDQVMGRHCDVLEGSIRAILDFCVAAVGVSRCCELLMFF